MNYRRSYVLFASNGILFNHESERRGETFVTRKITRGATRIKVGLQEKLYLGNLEAKRDWGYAKDYVEGMWRVLQHDEPDDFVLATGQTQSVKDFLTLVFGALDLNWERYVEIDPRYFRPRRGGSLVRRLQQSEGKAGLGAGNRFGRTGSNHGFNTTWNWPSGNLMPRRLLATRILTLEIGDSLGRKTLQYD